MTDSINSANSSNGEAFLSNAFGDQYLYSVNRNLFNNSGADAVYQGYLPDIFWNKNSLFVVIGTDSGLLVEHLAKHGVPSGSRYLFVELAGLKDQVFQRLASVKNTPGIILSDLTHWNEEAESLGYKNYLYMNQVYLIQSVGSMHAYLSEYRELTRIISDESTTWQWHLRQQYAAAKFIKCQLFNAADNKTPTSVLKNSFLGKTAVLLASGPSLDDLLPWVKENRENLLVASISRSARRLIEANLTPDVVITIDPNRVSFEVSKEMLTFNSEVLLVNSYQALPRLVSQWRGPKVYMGTQLPWKEEPDNPYGGITVTNAGIEALLSLGVSQIILAGVDLCFRPDGSLYSSGTSENDAGPVLGHIGPKVETNDGQMAETFDGYAQAVHNLTEQATRAKELGCILINPAPSAANIPNIEHRHVEDIQLEALNEPPVNTFRRYLPPNTRESRLNHNHQLEHELTRVKYKVEKVKTLCSEILICIDGLFGRNGIKQDNKYKNKIDKIETRLSGEFQETVSLVRQFAIREFLRYVGRGQISKRRLEEAEKDGRDYYMACIDGATKLIECIDIARQRIAMRISEENQSPDIKTLCKQWQGYNTPGRALVWQHYHPKAYQLMGPEALEIFNDVVAKFNNDIFNKDTFHTQYCQQRTSLDNVPSKIKLLFVQHDTSSLKNLINGLSNYPEDKEDHKEAQTCMHYAAGCLAELQNEHDEALKHYREVPEGPLLEDALKRISHICIQQGDANNALLALECLSHMSISYVPTYAEVAWLAGHVNEANELFNQYLQQVPDDLKTYLRLSKLYIKQGIVEAAHLALTHVLDQDPHNQEAKNLLESLDQSTEQQTQPSSASSAK